MKGKTVLAELREKKGETLADVAGCLKTSVNRYYKIEAGMRPAPPEFVDLLSQHFGVRPDEIFFPRSFTARTTRSV